MCRSHAEDPAEARRQAHRPAGVAADGKVHHAGGDGRSRPADEPPVTRPGAFTFTGAP